MGDDREDDRKDDKKADRKQDKKLEFQGRLGAARAADYLSAIADGLRQGSLTLAAGGRTVRLQPADVVKVELEAEGKPDKGRGSLELEISWKPGATTDDEEEITIEAGRREELVTAATGPEPHDD